jgi:hypothetical protein
MEAFTVISLDHVHDKLPHAFPNSKASRKAKVSPLELSSAEPRLVLLLERRLGVR